MEGIGKEMFEEWMKRLMERIDRLDSIISVLINKEAAGVKYMDGERLYDNQDLCEMLRTSKRSLQRFRSEYGLRYQKISRKTYYKESDVLEFISRNMEEVTLDGKPFRRKKIFNFMIRYLCPIFAAIILISSVANALGWIAM